MIDSVIRCAAKIKKIIYSCPSCLDNFPHFLGRVTDNFFNSFRHINIDPPPVRNNHFFGMKEINSNILLEYNFNITVVISY